MESVYIYSAKNTGEWRQTSHESDAISRALINHRETTGEWNWNAMLIEKLPCDNRQDHYPDLCYHYRITVSGEDDDGVVS